MGSHHIRSSKLIQQLPSHQINILTSNLQEREREEDDDAILETYTIFFFQFRTFFIHSVPGKIEVKQSMAYSLYKRKLIHVVRIVAKGSCAVAFCMKSSTGLLDATRAALWAHGLAWFLPVPCGLRWRPNPSFGRFQAQVLNQCLCINL